MWAMRRRAAAVLVAGWLAVGCATGTAQAVTGDGGGTAASQAPAVHAQEPPSRAAYIADRLRENPVYISDQLPREVPRSTAPYFAAQAERLDVPTYVMVLPDASANVREVDFLAGVHDRLGRPGLYVSLGETGIPTVRTYDVELTGAEDAARATLYELPHDATPREAFGHFVDVLASGAAHQRYEAARARYGGASSDAEPAPLHTSHTDRENQSFVTGIAVTGVPLTAVLITLYVRRRRRLGREAAEGGTARGRAQARARAQAQQRQRGGSKGRSGTADRQPAERPGRLPRRLRIGLLAGSLAVAGGIAFTASQLFDDTTTGDGTVPTAADMRARVDRVAKGLDRSPLYLDPETEPGIDAKQRARLLGHLDALRVPVLIAAVPSPTDDESGGDAELLAEALHARVQRDAVLVIADPVYGSIEVVNYGAPIDSTYLLDRPSDLSFSSDGNSDLGARLDRLLTYIGKAPRAAAGSLPYAPDSAEDPAEEQALPSVFGADFGPGLAIGAVLASLVLGLVALVGALFTALLRLIRPGGRSSRSPGSSNSSGASGTSGASGVGTPEAEAPTAPSVAWLRRTARQEADALTGVLDSASDGGSGLPERSRRRAWECLDAAALLLDGDSDSRIDADAQPATLACAIALTRAGRAAVEESAAPEQLCARNPLHGPAREVRRIRPDGGGAARSLPVCRACRAEPGAVLRLGPSPDAKQAAYLPYPALPGPLAAVADGAAIDQLTRDIRESYGVH